MGHQVVHGLFGHFEAHEGPVPVVLALRGKAVVTGQVAGVGHVEAHGFDDAAAAFFELPRQRFIGVGGIEFLVLFEVAYIADAFEDFPFVNGGVVPILFQHGGDDVLFRVVGVHGDDIVGQVVDGVDGPGAGVEDDVVPVQLILMKQFAPP